MKQLIIVFLTTFIFQLNYLSGQLNCLPDTQTGCQQTNSLSEDVFIPQYPNCPITVTYDIRLCTDEDGNQEIQIAGLEITNIDPNSCGVFVNDFFRLLLDAIFGPSQQPFIDWFDQVISSIQEEVADNTFSRLLLLGEEVYDRLECNSDDDLDLGNPLTQVSFFQASCSMICVVSDPETVTRPVAIPCGDICCKKTITYCITEGTDFEDAQNEDNWTKSDPIIEAVEDAPCEEFDAPASPPNTLFCLECSASCGN